MQHYKPKSLEEMTLDEYLGSEKAALFRQHIEVANRPKLIELLGISGSKFYRALRVYRKEKAKGKGW